jgi:hypothetical protein
MKSQVHLIKVIRTQLSHYSNQRFSGYKIRNSTHLFSRVPVLSSHCGWQTPSRPLPEKRVREQTSQSHSLPSSLRSYLTGFSPRHPPPSPFVSLQRTYLFSIWNSHFYICLFSPFQGIHEGRALREHAVPGSRGRSITGHNSTSEPSKASLCARCGALVGDGRERGRSLALAKNGTKKKLKAEGVGGFGGLEVLQEDPKVACHSSSRHERPLASPPAGPALTRCSSISISPALSTMGPRTAYSTAFTCGFMDSRVRMRSRGLRSGRTLSAAEASAAALLWLRPQGPEARGQEPRRTSTAARCIANLPRLALAQKEGEQDVTHSPRWTPVPQEPKALGRQRQPSSRAVFPPSGYWDLAPCHCSTKTLHR